METNVHIDIGSVHICLGSDCHHSSHHHHHHCHLPLAKIGPFAEQDIPKGPEIQRMNLEFTDSQRVAVEYGNPVDRKGHETTVEAGSVRWKSSDESVATVVPISETPISATIVAGAPGVAEVWPVADADLGGGVKEVEGERIGVHITPGEATGFGAPTAGAVEEQEA